MIFRLSTLAISEMKPKESLDRAVERRCSSIAELSLAMSLSWVRNTVMLNDDSNRNKKDSAKYSALAIKPYFLVLHYHFSDGEL